MERELQQKSSTQTGIKAENCNQYKTKQIKKQKTIKTKKTKRKAKNTLIQQYHLHKREIKTKLFEKF